MFSVSAVAQKSSLADSVPAEDLQILKDIMKDAVSTADPYLDRAERLTYRSYDQGEVIDQSRCSDIEARFAKNYPLQQSTPDQIHICTNSQDSSSSQPISYFLSTAPVKNDLNVNGAMVLTVAHNFENSAHVQRQFVFDEKTKLIQYNWSIVKDGAPYYTMISALNEQGDVLSKVTRTWANPHQPYAWKSWVGYVSANGNVSPAFLRVQNDGQGDEVAEREYVAPYQWEWQAFEVSPYKNVGGLYQTENGVVSGPDSRATLKLYSKPGVDCGVGEIGSDDDEDSIRQFGNDKCATEMDVNSIVF
jgi:hypothetical protein